MLKQAPALMNADFKDKDYEAYYLLREQASTGQLSEQTLANLVIDKNFCGENCDPMLGKKKK